MIEHFKKIYNLPEKQLEILYEIIGDEPAIMGYYCRMLKAGVEFAIVVELVIKEMEETFKKWKMMM